jgi:hypothetical protein
LYRVSLTAILSLPDGPARTARLAAWVQGLFPAGSVPVLVGGAAVELLTGGAYVTGDLDFVGPVPAAVARALAGAGFERHRRHWVHEAGQVYLEFPCGALHPEETTARLEVEGVDLLVISPEDLVAERLGAWKHWRSTVDGVNAWLLLRALGRTLDRERLRCRCEQVEASDALGSLLGWSDRLGGREPAAEEVETWARRGP